MWLLDYNSRRFPFSSKFRKFWLEVKWNGPFRFGPTGIFGTTLGAIHSTKISGNFGPKLNGYRFGSVQPEKFWKNWCTFWGGQLFPVGPVWILIEWIAPHEPWSTLTNFDWSGHFGRLDRMSLSIWQNCCPQYLSFVFLLTRTITKSAVAWVGSL